MSRTLEGKILLLPERRDPEREAVAVHWRKEGGRAVYLGRFWDPPPLPSKGLRPYGNDTFCLILAQKLGLRERSPPDDLLVHLGAAWLGRRVALTRLDALDALPPGFDWPVFAKSAVPKLFTAGVYADASAVGVASRDLPGETAVLLSEVVKIDAEVRSFVLDGRVLSAAAYEGELGPHELDAAVDLAEAIATNPMVPPRTSSASTTCTRPCTPQGFGVSGVYPATSSAMPELVSHAWLKSTPRPSEMKLAYWSAPPLAPINQASPCAGIVRWEGPESPRSSTPA